MACPCSRLHVTETESKNPTADHKFYESAAEELFSSADSPSTAIDCGPLPAPVKGEVSLTATVFESVATYSCFPGYTLQGNATRECGADAQWTGQAPTCESKSLE